MTTQKKEGKGTPAPRLGMGQLDWLTDTRKKPSPEAGEEETLQQGAEPLEAPAKESVESPGDVQVVKPPAADTGIQMEPAPPEPQPLKPPKTRNIISEKRIDKSEFEKISITVSPEQFEQLDDCSRTRRKQKVEYSYSSIVREALDEYFEKRAKKAKAPK